MKEYGFNKATEFTKKQIGVIYYKAKIGELKVEKWFMSFLYDLADYYGTDSNRLVEERESEVLKILDNVFSNKIDEAQELINEKEDKWYESFGEKMKKSCERNLFVA